MGGIKVLHKKMDKPTYSPLVGEIQPHEQRPETLRPSWVGFTVITKDNTSLKLF